MSVGARVVSWAWHWPHSVCPGLPPVCATPFSLWEVNVLLPLGPFPPESPLQEVHTVLPEELASPQWDSTSPSSYLSPEKLTEVGKSTPQPQHKAGERSPRMEVLIS